MVSQIRVSKGCSSLITTLGFLHPDNITPAAVKVVSAVAMDLGKAETRRRVKAKAMGSLSR